MKFTFQPESKPLDGYTIKRAIHRGGFGEVYYALSDAGKEVALKLLRQHLDVELRGVSQCLNLKHPNLVTIFDIRTDADGDHWVVMEYISGKSLNQVVEQHPHGMPIDEVEKWLAGMAEGLTFLHDRGLVHRDLKPANVFIENGVVKIGDVGLSKFISESHRSAQTQSVGTVYYMAPEVAHGRYGREVDTYSLGIMLYELLTGRVPFTGESAGEILMKHLSERPDLSRIPTRLRSVVAHALEKDPLRRTPSAARLLEDFRKAIRGFDIPRDIPNESFIGHTVPDSSTARREGATPVPPPFNWRDQVARDAKEVAQHAKKAAQHVQDWARDVGCAAKDGPFRKWCRSDANGHRGHYAQLRENTAGTDEQQYPHTRRGFWIVIGGIVLLILLVSDTMQDVVEGLVPLGFLALIIYGVYFVYRMLTNPTVAHFAPPGAPLVGQPPRAPATPPMPLQNPPNVAQIKLVTAPLVAPERPKKPILLTPATLRAIPWRRRMSDLTGSLVLASLSTALITVGLMSFSDLLKTPAQTGLFAATTLIASWGILALSKITEGRDIDSLVRRMLFLGLGLCVGTTAYGLDRILLVEEYSRGSFNTHGPSQLTDFMFRSFGPFSLQIPTANGQGTEPTPAGYLVFFGALFALRHWWWHADAFRWRRFRPLSVLLTTFVALVVVTVWIFPQYWGVAWGAAISSVVQLSAPWVPPKKRPELMEGAHGT